MRDHVIAELAERVKTDEEFRARARQDLEGTLKAEGYELTDDELEAARRFHAQAAELSDEELAEALSGDTIGQGG